MFKKCRDSIKRVVTKAQGKQENPKHKESISLSNFDEQLQAFYSHVFASL